MFAVKFNTPIFIWGETAWDISGMFSPDDFVEFNNTTKITVSDITGKWSIK